MDEQELNYDDIMKIINERDEKEKERRKRTDLIGRVVTLLSTLAWVAMIAVWVVLDYAAPDRDYGWLSFFYVNFGAEPSTRTRWDFTLVNAAYILILVSLGICAIALVLNRLHKKRKGDKLKKSVFIIGGITVIGFIVFLIRFWSILF